MKLEFEQEKIDRVVDAISELVVAVVSDTDRECSTARWDAEMVLEDALRELLS